MYGHADLPECRVVTEDSGPENFASSVSSSHLPGSFSSADKAMVCGHAQTWKGCGCLMPKLLQQEQTNERARLISECARPILTDSTKSPYVVLWAKPSDLLALT